MAIRLPTVVASGAYSDLTGRPTLGTMAAQAASNYVPVSSYTAADVLAKLVAVSGPGSGLNADKIDGYHLADLDYRYVGGVRLSGEMGIPVDKATTGYVRFQAPAGCVITNILQASESKLIEFVNCRAVQAYSNFTATWVTISG